MNIINVGTQQVTNNQKQSNYYKGAQERGERFDPSGQNEDAVELNISIEGLKKLDESMLSQDRDLSKVTKSANANQSIDHLIPAYSGIAKADQAIHDALQNADDATKAFVYRTIRGNLLMKEANGLSETERQANISLGMEKAVLAANTMIDEGHRESFLDAMNSIAKLASAGIRQEDGTIDYGNSSRTYIGQDGRLVQTTDIMAIMKKTDKKAYEECEGLKQDSKAYMKYYLNWAAQNRSAVSEVAEKEKENQEKVLGTAKVDQTFQGAGSTTKEAFQSFLQQFAEKNPGFLRQIIEREQLAWAK